MMIKRFNLLIIIFLLLFGVEAVFANYAFYRTVTNTCNSYHIDAQSSEMYFGKEEANKDKFYISVTSNRNNFEVALIVGFVSVGQAINHQNDMVEKGLIDKPVIPNTIHVTVNIPMGRNDMIFSASATADQVVKLANGVIDSAEFMRLIKNSMVTL